jgi:hypothetical protein
MPWTRTFCCSSRPFGIFWSNYAYFLSLGMLYQNLATLDSTHALNSGVYMCVQLLDWESIGMKLTVLSGCVWWTDLVFWNVASLLTGHGTSKESKLKIFNFQQNNALNNPPPPPIRKHFFTFTYYFTVRVHAILHFLQLYIFFNFQASFSHRENACCCLFISYFIVYWKILLGFPSFGSCVPQIVRVCPSDDGSSLQSDGEKL